jgi:hypothetical protein
MNREPEWQPSIPDPFTGQGTEMSGIPSLPQMHEQVDNLLVQHIEQRLEKWNQGRPQYPTDPAEEERRFNLLRVDPVYNALRVNYQKAATDEGYREMVLRRRAIMTSLHPEVLIPKPEDNS